MWRLPEIVGVMFVATLVAGFGALLWLLLESNDQFVKQCYAQGGQVESTFLYFLPIVVDKVTVQVPFYDVRCVVP